MLIHTDKPCDWCKYNEVFGKNETHHSEVYLNSVGKTFALSEMPVTNRDGTRSKLSIYRDIFRSVEQDAKLKFSMESYQRLFKHAGCGVFISSKQGRFLDVNPTLLKMLGYEAKDEFLSLNLATDLYIRPEDRREYQKIIEKKRLGRRLRGPVEKMSIQQVYSEEVSKTIMETMKDEGYGGKGRLNSYPLTFTKENGELVEGNLSASIIYDEKDAFFFKAGSGKPGGTGYHHGFG